MQHHRYGRYLVLYNSCPHGTQSWLALDHMATRQALQVLREDLAEPLYSLTTNSLPWPLGFRSYANEVHILIT
jgi:hypothetical protein